jgi:acyl dehydratase
MRFFEDFPPKQKRHSSRAAATSPRRSKSAQSRHSGGGCAHGALHDAVMAFYGIDRMHFTKPVHIGDMIQPTKKLFQKGRRCSGPRLLIFETIVVNRKSETILICIGKLVVRRWS